MGFLSKLFTKSNDDSDLSFEARFGSWLGRISSTEAPNPQVMAFNIGLFESESGFQAYLCGSTHYSVDDNDWACEEAFTPSERYFPIPAAFASGKDWQEIQSAVISATKAYLASSGARDSFLNKANVVTVGFDEGDLVRVA
ncbi:MAG: hypothetical protein HXX12_00830 [Geothrix sp.]|uniref:hypothetical protein n=1 Tax=Geothrix sp. TaxID=1962974 RepID=UPI00183F03C4|nr:hypothetical protein [Geothrix sp.]NWJ39497.1 hypothetical protein [Geothrix sp.]NWJ39500.1 hypothetical protein [Geothrix sp.]WIL19280.1 MAG: hypothetical protein QOZ81_001790 [Geothrix sp.]